MADSIIFAGKNQLCFLARLKLTNLATAKFVSIIAKINYCDNQSLIFKKVGKNSIII